MVKGQLILTVAAMLLLAGCEGDYLPMPALGHIIGVIFAHVALVLGIAAFSLRRNKKQ